MRIGRAVVEHVFLVQSHGSKLHATLQLLPRTGHPWAGHDDEHLFPAIIEQHGAAPEFSFSGEEQEGLTKVRADVPFPCKGKIRKRVDADVPGPRLERRRRLAATLASPALLPPGLLFFLMACRRTGFHLRLRRTDRLTTILVAFQLCRNVDLRLIIGRFSQRHQSLDLGLKLVAYFQLSALCFEALA